MMGHLYNAAALCSAQTVDSIALVNVMYVFLYAFLFFLHHAVVKNVVAKVSSADVDDAHGETVVRDE